MTTQQPDRQEPSLASLIEMRTRTDIDLPISWIVIPLGNYLVWAIYGILIWSSGTGLGAGYQQASLAGLGIVGLGSSIAASYVVFTLMNRGNEHCWRTRSMAWRAIASLESRAKASGVSALLPLNSAEDGFYKLVREERDRSAILWGLICVIPFVGALVTVIVLWRLSRDLKKHARLEHPVLEDIDRTLRVVGTQGIRAAYAGILAHDALGVAIVPVSILEVVSSYFIGFTGALVLIYLTIGAFSLFWIDLSVRDPRSHFHAHSQLEADMMQAFPEMRERSGGAV